MSSDQGQDRDAPGEEPSPGKARPWWKPTQREIKVITQIGLFLGPLSSVVTIVALLYAHGGAAILLWSLVLMIAVPLSVMVLDRVITRKVMRPILIVAGGVLAVVLAGAFVGAVIGYLLRPASGEIVGSHHPPLASGSFTALPSTSTSSSGPPPTSPGAVTTTGTISVPVNGADVTADVMLPASGTVHDLPRGYRLDLFLKFAGMETYYAAGDPNSALTLVNGRWSGSIYIGAATQCTVYLVELSPGSVQLMNSEISDQSNGYPSIDALGTTLASVSLTST